MKIRNILSIFLVLVTTFLQAPVAFAQESEQPSAPRDLVAEADSAYNAAEYSRAVELYSTAIDSLGRSANLYYNLGNSYYRTGHPGRAIVAYERAMRINPADKDLRSNLEFVNSRITDRPGERGTLIAQFVRSIVLWTSPNAWAWIAFGLFVVTLAAVAVYCFSGVIVVRKIGFFGGIVMLLLTCFTVFIAVQAASRASARDVAIVIDPSTILSTSPRSPRNRSEEAMLLHEGTKVKILDSVMVTTDSVPSMWLDVEVDNNHRAWVNSRAVERI